MDLDTLIRDADPTRRVTIPDADPADARRISSGPRHSAGGMAATLAGGVAVAVALAVTVLALVTLGHRHGTPRATAIPTAARPLASILSVLRGPETAVDRELVATVRKLRTPEPRLVRLAAVTPWGEQLVLAALKGRPDDTLGLFTVDASGRPGGGVSCGCGMTPGVIEAGRGWSLEGAGRNFAGGSTGVRLFTVVPDGVARVVFVLPSQPVPSSVPGGPVYSSPLGVLAIVHDNVAFAQVLNRECCDGNLVIRWYAANGRLIKTAGRPSDSNRIIHTPKASPETPLSRAAERDPSTPNPVLALPRSGTPHTIFRIRWRLLLTDADYTINVSGPNGPRCRGANSLGGTSGGGVNDVRGQLYGANLGADSGARSLCPGVYHLTVSVHDLGSAGNLKRGAPPFGSTSFTVKP